MSTLSQRQVKATIGHICWKRSCNHLALIKLLIFEPLATERSSPRRYSVKEAFLNVSQNSQKKSSVGLYFSIKLQAGGRQLNYKIGSCTGFFLWTLRIFWEHLFLQNISGWLLLNETFSNMKPWYFRVYISAINVKCFISTECLEKPVPGRKITVIGA